MKSVTCSILHDFVVPVMKRLNIKDIDFVGALYLDGGIDLAERVFGDVLFGDDAKLDPVWKNLPPHPLQVSDTC